MSLSLGYAFCLPLLGGALYMNHMNLCENFALSLRVSGVSA